MAAGEQHPLRLLQEGEEMPIVLAIVVVAVVLLVAFVIIYVYLRRRGTQEV